MDSLWIWVKTMYCRVTISKITTCFFLFSFLHCFIHAIVQSVLFSSDVDAKARVSGIVQEAQVPQNEVAWLVRDHDNFTLRLCKDVPVLKSNENSCELIFQSGAGPIQVPQGFRRRGEQTGTFLSNDVAIGSMTLVNPVVKSSVIIGVDFQSASVNGGLPVFLDGQCTRVLVYANQLLANSKREELALIGSEFWLLGISVFAIMYDSIPHLLAGFFMRVLSTAWSSYSVWRTLDIRVRFQTLITDGPCGIDLFPSYFHDRMAVQIADLTLNIVALLLSCYLVWNLVRTYATCMFKRLGAPKHILKLYRLFLGVFICLQMSVYLLVTSTSLWIDELVNGAIVRISEHNRIYLGSCIFVNVSLIPWIAMGWFAVRREMRLTMLAFLSIGAVYVVGWSLMYYSQVFRWTWIQGPFFASLVVAAQLVQLASMILGVVCRRNFHRGLAQYLYAESLLERSDFEPDVFSHQANDDTEKQQAVQVDFKVVSVSLDADAASDASSVYDVERDRKVNARV